MAQDICPIFERDGGENIHLVGAWMLHPINLSIVPDAANFSELGEMGGMVASYFRTTQCRQVPNAESDIGIGCVFLGGAFVVAKSERAPNEFDGAPGRAFRYTRENREGVAICVRESLVSPAH